jgi:cell division protein FtsI/penicillin-binding protein 2
VPAKVRPATYAVLRRLLDIDSAGLRQRVDAAEPDWFVEVITLRRADYTPLRSQLLETPGVVLDPGQMSLAPTSAWARAVLGAVSPPTAETLAAAGPFADGGDLIGASGLQAAYQRTLAGTPAVRIRAVDEGSGRVIATLFARRAVPGTPLRTTLDFSAQSAAERALTELTRTTALVAVQASTGNILAAANGPGVTSYNNAFVGRYPPGSTFKVVSAAALLDAGVVRVDEQVPCPDAVSVTGKTFRNYEDGLMPGGGTFARAFALSCNTTIVSLADRLNSGALGDMARRFGVGAPWEVGVDAYSGQAPAVADAVSRAAAVIGQGEVLASPLTMAMVAAAVASGQPMTPTLLPADNRGGPVAEQLPAALVRDLRTLMRAVVTSGTGQAVDLPGLPVAAKTGTAEYGSAPTRTHAWLIGYRGDLAFAVVVEDAKSGAHDAAPVAAQFLAGLPDGVYR